MPRAATVAVQSPMTSSPAGTKSATTVTVACKIPHGIVMQLCQETTYWEETMTGGKERKRYDRTGEKVFIRGNGRPVNPPQGFPEPGPSAGGYGLTYDVDADFFARWMEQNKRAPMVINGLIFGMTTIAGATAKAKEQSGKRSGLEPLEIDNDPRVPKPTRNEVHQIAKAELTH